MRIFNHGNNAVLPMIKDKKLINRIRLKRIMKEEIIDVIRYRFDDDNMTAEVIERHEGIWNDYKGDIIIPDSVVFKTTLWRRCFRSS